MKVKKAMHEGVFCVSPDTPLTQIAKHMQENDIGAVPVADSHRLVGMITDRDIVCRAVARGRDLSALKARDVMTPGVVCCDADEDIEDALEMMEMKKIRRLPVLDDEDRLVGILSLGDISHALPEELTAQVVKAVTDHHR